MTVKELKIFMNEPTFRVVYNGESYETGRSSTFFDYYNVVAIRSRLILNDSVSAKSILEIVCK